MDPRRLLPGLLTVTVVCLVATLGVVSLRPDGGGRGSAEAASGATPSTPGSGAPDGPRPPAEILRAWDRRRAQAWARGDLPALADLYRPGSLAGAADLAGLRGWVGRGLRVVGLQTQVLEVDVASRTRRRLRLVVTDRLVGGEAVGGSGTAIALPTDRASTRVVTLERVGGRWVVAEVLAQ